MAANGAGSGFSIGVVNARWIKPLDPRLDQWAARYRYVVTLEDNVVSGGFGSAVLEELARHGLAGRVSVWGLPDRFLPAGSVEELLHEVGLDEDAILRDSVCWSPEPIRRRRELATFRWEARTVRKGPA